MAADAAGLLRHTGPRLLAALLGLELATAGLPLAVIAVIGVLVGRVAAGAAVTGPLAALSLLLLAQQLVGPFRAAVAYRVTRRVDGIVRGQVMALANRSTGVAPLEVPLPPERPSSGRPLPPEVRAVIETAWPPAASTCPPPSGPSRRRPR